MMEFVDNYAMPIFAIILMALMIIMLVKLIIVTWE